MKNLFLTAAFVFIAVVSYGQTFTFTGIVSPKGSSFTLDEIQKDPEFYGFSAEDIREMKTWTIKLTDKDGGLEILSNNLGNAIYEGMFFTKDPEEDNLFIYENDDVRYDITLKTTLGYYRSFILDIYEDEAFWWFNKDMKKQFGFMFERK